MKVGSKMLKIKEYSNEYKEEVIEYLECYQRDTYIFTEESVVLKDNKVSFLASERKSIYMI